MTDSSGLTTRGKSILSAIRSGTSLQELSKAIGASPATIGIEIAKLQLAGYLTDDSRLTARALQVLGD